MQKGELVRCINVKTGRIKMLVPAVANSPTRLKNLGYMRAELEAPVMDKTKKQYNGFEASS